MKNLDIYLLLILFIFNSIEYSQAEIRHDEWNMSIAFSDKHDTEKLTIKVIEKAEDSLRLSAYTISSKNIMKALLKAHDKGVEVRLLVDHNQNINNKYNRSALNILSLAGIPIRTVDIKKKKYITYKINHERFIIVDNKTIQSSAFNNRSYGIIEIVHVSWDNLMLASEHLEYWLYSWKDGKEWKVNN